MFLTLFVFFSLRAVCGCRIKLLTVFAGVADFEGVGVCTFCVQH